MKFKKYIPNIITTTRLISIILGSIFFLKEKITLSIILFIYGAVSDFLDGYFARRLSAYSKVGKYLDAVSDKLYALAIIILSLIKGNYIILAPTVLELVISIINFLTIKRYNKAHTSRVGKFKTTILFPVLILSLLSVYNKWCYYLFIIIMPLCIYLEVETIISYINEYNNYSEEKVVDLRGKTFKEKIKALTKEFMQYILNPVKLEKRREENDRYKYNKTK